MQGRPIGAGLAVVAALTGAASLAPAATPERVTIRATPTIADPLVTLSGEVDSRRAQEDITIEARDCGAKPPMFRAVSGAHTGAGGSWSVQFAPVASTTLRAVWNRHASAPITVRRRATVQIAPLASGRRFRVTVAGTTPFWRKRVVLQRLDRRFGTWRPFRTVVLTETAAAPGSFWVRSWADTRIPTRGLSVRAVLPLAQARPCYLEGRSKALRT